VEQRSAVDGRRTVTGLLPLHFHTLSHPQHPHRRSSAYYRSLLFARIQSHASIATWPSSGSHCLYYHSTRPPAAYPGTNAKQISPRFSMALSSWTERHTLDLYAIHMHLIIYPRPDQETYSFCAPFFCFTLFFCWRGSWMTSIIGVWGWRKRTWFAVFSCFG
jgi:hypothetical protein